jgi:CBS domain-containing protein
LAHEGMSVCEAAQLMLEQHVGSLVVAENTSTGALVVGVLTDRDIVIAVVARDFNAQAARVGDIMSRNPITCTTEDSMTDALNLMRDHGVRRIPVTDMQGMLAGIVTLDDVMEIVADDLQRFVQVIQREREQEVQLHR